MSRTQELIKKLEAERDELPELDIFGDENDLTQYDSVIRFLKTGQFEDDDESDLLSAARFDLETLYSDYGISLKPEGK